ncbi:hypothetical protein SERLA73DRAFT_178800 [Serpula lacrymans var. lacrymans S7.3]|uniref:Uncharacterized protein n=2 Tax=Serpula lacrymans var. lacrymans TaxID=341189 RepID=F8PSY2_SERL3|nr:hypothetical protein SERLA73DRAFT_178800 [Serpula lacrymans var. lacrymans S7.3]
MWPFTTLFALAGLIPMMVHAFYCWRIWVIGRSLTLPIVIMLVSSGQFGLAITEGQSFIGNSLADIMNVSVGGDKRSYFTWVIGSCLCDIMIAIQTTRLLFRNKSGTNFKKTRSLVVKLVKLTIDRNNYGHRNCIGNSVLIGFFWIFPVHFNALPFVHALC